MALSRLANALNEKVEKQAQRIILRRQKIIADKVFAIHRNILSRLASKMINKSGPPSLGKYSSPWTPLTASYKEQKRRQGYRGKYFARTGGLERTLKSPGIAETLFGKPVISFRRTRIKAKPDQFGVIKVDLFPKIAQNIFTKRIDEADFFDSETTYKLKASNDLPRRPVFQNFLKWYVDIELRKVLRGIR